MNNTMIIALTRESANTRTFPAMRPINGVLPIDDVRAELALCEQGYAGGEERARWVRRQLARLAR